MIKDVQIVENSGWRRKHLQTIRHSYADAPHLEFLESHLLAIYEQDWSSLVDLNVAMFSRLLECLNLNVRLIFSSDLDIGGRGHQRVVDICEHLNADAYLSGQLGRDYLKPQEFRRRSIQLEYFEFRHPEYTQQHDTFVPYLSIVDLVANVGEDAPSILGGTGRAAPEYPVTRDHI
jgi:hypothetical protein